MRLSQIVATFACFILTADGVHAGPAEDNPDYKLYMKARAEMLGMEDELAIKDFTTLLQGHLKYNPAAWVGRGNSYYHLGRFEEADADYRKGIDLALAAPGSQFDFALTDAVQRLQERLKSQNNLKAALTLWDKVIAHSPAPRNYYFRGCCEYELGQFDKAEKDLKVGLSDPKEFVDNTILLAKCRQKQGKLASAIEAYTQAIEALKKPPNSFTRKQRYTVYADRAKCYREAKQIDLAKKDEAEFAKYRDGMFELTPFREHDL